MLGLRWDPVDAERCPHDGQSRYALADRNVQGAELHPIKRSACAKQCCQRMQVPCRDEHGVRARRGSDRLHLGFLSRSPEQQYPGAETLAEHIDERAKMRLRATAGLAHDA